MLAKFSINQESNKYFKWTKYQFLGIIKIIAWTGNQSLIGNSSPTTILRDTRRILQMSDKSSKY